MCFATNGVLKTPHRHTHWPQCCLKCSNKPAAAISIGRGQAIGGLCCGAEALRAPETCYHWVTYKWREKVG